MNAAMEATLRSWKRRVHAMVGRAIINLVNDTLKCQETQISLLAGETQDGIERFQEYGFTSVPLPGAEAVAVFPFGDRSNGIVIACEDRRYRMKGMQGGEVALYDDQGQCVHLTRTGIVILGAGKQITIMDTPKVRCETARLEVTGDIIDNCDGQANTVADMRTIHNQHVHPDVSVGIVDTGLTTQTM